MTFVPDVFPPPPISRLVKKLHCTSSKAWLVHSCLYPTWSSLQSLLGMCLTLELIPYSYPPMKANEIPTVQCIDFLLPFFRPSFGLPDLLSFASSLLLPGLKVRIPPSFRPFFSISYIAHFPLIFFLSSLPTPVGLYYRHQLPSLVF